MMNENLFGFITGYCHLLALSSTVHMQENSENTEIENLHSVFNIDQSITLLTCSVQSRHLQNFIFSVNFSTGFVRAIIESRVVESATRH